MKDGWERKEKSKCEEELLLVASNLKTIRVVHSIPR